MSIKTANAGTTGASGLLTFSSGVASGGDSGSISIGSGSATAGQGGPISVVVGGGTSGAGGSITITAGATSAATKRGGDTVITAGAGSGTSGIGGDIKLVAGAGTTHGNVYIIDGTGATRVTVDELQYTVAAPTQTYTAATQFSITGGSVDITAGAAADIVLATANNGAGAGGNIDMQPGTGSSTAGSIRLLTSAGTAALVVADTAATTGIELVTSAGFATAVTAGSAKVTKMLSGTCTVTSLSITSGAVGDATCTVTGAALNDVVQLGVSDGALTADIVIAGAWVSATDTLTIRLQNVNGATVAVSEAFTYLVTTFVTHT
jgi:hypothetical protein